MLNNYFFVDIKENKKTSEKHMPLLQIINFTLQKNFLGFLVTEETSNKDNVQIEDFLKM